MKRLFPVLLSVGAMTAGCASDPDPWIASGALAADAALGVSSKVASFAPQLGAACEVGAAPMVEIVTQGALGVASVGPSSRTIAIEDDPCDGAVIAETAVFYEGTTAGFDQIVLRERTGAAKPDVIHTAHIRVR